MVSTTSDDGDDDDDEWTAAREVFALPELCALIAQHSDLVGAFRLKRVCRATRQGADEWLQTLPGLVVCGGVSAATTGVRPMSGNSEEVWRLDLAKLQWERMPSLTCERHRHACCVVRGRVVVFGGFLEGPPDVQTASVEILGYDDDSEEDIWKAMPPLSCGPVSDIIVTLAIDESESKQGQVLIIGGNGAGISASIGGRKPVHSVDLATGMCALLQDVGHSVITVDSPSVRLPDGRIVCMGGTFSTVTESPEQGSLNGASWQWRALPGMIVECLYRSGCLLSDGRFAVFGGLGPPSSTSSNSSSSSSDLATSFMSSCEVLTFDAHEERWDLLPPMREARCWSACTAIAGCVIVAGGDGSETVEVYEEGLNHWRLLPCGLPNDSDLCWTGMTLL
jgi:hypothetical protein